MEPLQRLQKVGAGTLKNHQITIKVDPLSEFFAKHLPNSQQLPAEVGLRGDDLNCLVIVAALYKIQTNHRGSFPR